MKIDFSDREIHRLIAALYCAWCNSDNPHYAELYRKMSKFKPERDPDQEDRNKAWASWDHKHKH
jgi:hypothetical protein